MNVRRVVAGEAVPVNAVPAASCMLIRVIHNGKSLLAYRDFKGQWKNLSGDALSGEVALETVGSAAGD